MDASFICSCTDKPKTPIMGYRTSYLRGRALGLIFVVSGSSYLVRLLLSLPTFLPVRSILTGDDLSAVVAVCVVGRCFYVSYLALCSVHYSRDLYRNTKASR